VIHGEVDAAINVAHGRALAAEIGNNAILAVIPRAGHAPPLTHPEMATAAMLARGMVTDHVPRAARQSVQWAYQRLLPLLGPPVPISAEALIRLKQVAEQHQPGDEAWARLVAEALEASS